MGIDTGAFRNLVSRSGSCSDYFKKPGIPCVCKRLPSGRLVGASFMRGIELCTREVFPVVSHMGSRPCVSKRPHGHEILLVFKREIGELDSASVDGCDHPGDHLLGQLLGELELLALALGLRPLANLDTVRDLLEHIQQLGLVVVVIAMV